ncbi:MAG: helix-turn-helix transcriptional regulator [Candidatus Competibacteraceae bacterium]|nr:helix-turn-helix transcriptional regulator [Candidatus Competibacteraceae bacterium]
MNKTIYKAEYQNFVKLLRTTREKRRLTQEQLAQRLGKTQSFIGKCERGERRLDVIELRIFCMALDVELEHFISLLEVELATVSSEVA